MTLRIDKLHLKNFRCFEDVLVDFHPNLTVLVAPNGQGKTAIVDAVSYVLTPFINALTDEVMIGLGRKDVRRARAPDGTVELMFPTVLDAVLNINGEVLPLQVISPRIHVIETVNSVMDQVSEVAGKFRQQLNDFVNGRKNTPPTLPAIAYCRIDRMWSGEKKFGGKDPTDTLTSRMRGYDWALELTADFYAFTRWYESMAREAQLEASRPDTRSPHQPQAKLEAIQRAVTPALAPTGWTALVWDFVEEVIAAEHETLGRLPVSLLSDGIRIVLALVADIAHRCVRLNPQFGAQAPALTPGVVVVDEIDMHLHPQWQQQILGSLRAAFPLIQFIVTTHSPHVLSTVPAECIRAIRVEAGQGIITTPQSQTQGVSSADILASVMGVDAIPQIEVVKKLGHYYALIEDGQSDTEQAKAIRKILDVHFGERHPVMLDCDRLIRFQKFKKTRATPDGERR